MWESLLWLFGAKTLAKVFKSMSPVESSVVDTVFKNKVQKHTPLIGIKDIVNVTNTVPVVGRAAPAVPIGNGEASHMWIEPLPVIPSDFISAPDLNDLKLLDKTSKEAWLQSKAIQLRKIIRRTTEGIASTSLTGTINWPLKLEGGGFTTYQVKFGNTLSYTLSKALDESNATITDVYNALRNMRKMVRANGYGGKIEIWAGENVYEKILFMIDKWTSTAKLKVEKKEAGIDIAGFLVKPMDETYQNPETKSAVDKVDPDYICMIALDGDHSLFYCALDDLDAKLRAWPFYLKPIESKNPSGITIIGMSKPLPVPNPKAIVWAKAVNV